MVKISIKILKALMKNFNVYEDLRAFPSLTIAILIDYVWIGVIEENRRCSSFLANNFKRLVYSSWKLVNSWWTLDSFVEIFRCTHEHPTNSWTKPRSVKIWYHNNIIFSHLNVNSIRDKFENLKLIIDEDDHILCPLWYGNQNWQIISKWTVQLAWIS